MPIYKEMQKYVQLNYGYKPKICWMLVSEDS